MFSEIYQLMSELGIPTGIGDRGRQAEVPIPVGIGDYEDIDWCNSTCLA